MYYEVGIQKLSDNQLSKLRNGHPIRVKLGNQMKSTYIILFYIWRDYIRNLNQSIMTH